MGRSKAVAAAALALLICPCAPHAAEPNPSAEEMRQKLDQKRSELEAAKERAKSIQSDVVEIGREREKLNANLVETAGSIQKTEKRLTAIEAKLVELEQQETALKADLASNHDKIAKLLAALQRMGRNPPPVLFTQRQDALQMVRSAMLLAFAFPELRTDAVGLATKLNDLIAVTTGIRTERDDLRTETARLTDARVRLSSLMETKRQAITERQAELKSVRQAAADISKSVTDLNELIGKLDQAVTNGTGLGAYNAEIAAAAVPKNDTAPAKAADAGTEVAVLMPQRVVPPPPIKPSVIELTPMSAVSGAASLGRLKPSVPFLLAKSQLPLPAQGRRVIQFGDKTQYGGQSKGIVIETRFGGQITAPCDGWIVYAGEFHSYGQLLIINAGEGYHVLLAGLSQIDVQPGQFVLAAEPVGTMSGPAAAPQATAASGKSQTNAPVLYVEFRKDGRPIDPDPWWAEGHQKVQG